MVSYRFGDFILDVDAFALTRAGEALPLQPKAFDVLRYLIEQRGRLVGKSELLEQLWRHENVNESVISWSVSHIRRALRQQRGDKHPIETVHGRGYRFAAQVSALTAADSAPVAPESRSRTTFVGRERAMSELQHCLQEAVAGRGQLCVITGEAGIGKSRCAEELARWAAGSGLRSVTSRCPPSRDTPPLWPIDAALDQLGDELATRARHVIASTRAATQLEQPGGSAAFRMIEGVVQALRELTAARPMLLVLDDLHWADAATLRLLASIAPELEELALCIVATLRDTEREAFAPGDRALLPVLRHARSIPLGSLTSAQVADLFAAIGKQRPSPELANAVHRASGGIPLFVQEVARALIREHGDGAFDRLQPEMVRIPALARDVLRQRIEQLPRATIELLSRAAVIGDSFELPLLARLSELDPETLLEGLAPAIAEGQLESDAPHVCRFAHSLFQSVLYEDLLPGPRMLLHRRLAELLAERADCDVRKGEIARHFYLSLAAGDYEEVARRTAEAGHAAVATLAFEEAVLYFSWALEAQLFAGGAQPRARAELLLSLAAAQRSAGRTGDAMDTAARVIELAQQHRMHDLVVGATRTRRATVALAMLPDSLTRSALELVLRQLPEDSDPVRISALAQLACVPPYDRDLARSKELSARAVALAEQHSDRELLFEALRARLFSLSGPDDVDEVLAVADRMLALESAGARSWQSGDARMARISAFLVAGRIADADAALFEMRAALRGRWGEATFYCQRMHAQRLFLDGNFDAAEQLCKEVFSQGVRIGISYAELLREAHALNLELERWGPAAVVERLAFSSARTLSRPRRAGMARIAAQAGELDFARAELRELGDPSDYPRDAGYLHMLASLAVCAAAVDDKARCEQLLSLLSPYPELNTPDAMGYYLGSVAHFMGLLSSALGRTVRARGCFEQALEHNRRMGYRAGVVRTTLSLAQLERRHGQRKAARELLQSARSQAYEIGMHSAVADADAALASG